MSNDQRAQAHNALKQAERAAKRGNLAEAERWSKAAERCAAAAQALASAPRVEEEIDEDELRAEIMRRLARLVEVETEVTAWEAERDAYLERIGQDAGEPPLRPAPYIEADMEVIAAGGEAKRRT